MADYLKLSRRKEIAKAAEREGYFIIDVDHTRAKPRLVAQVLKFAERGSAGGGDDGAQ